MFALVPSSQFDRSFRRFVRRHPELRARLARVLEDLQADPAQPRLRLHALTGRLSGLYAVSVTRAFRIVLQIDNQSRTLTLIDIGAHEEVYG